MRKFLTKDVRQTILDDFETKDDRTQMFVEPKRIFAILEDLLSRMNDNEHPTSIIDSISSTLPVPHRYCVLQYLIEAIPELPNQDKWQSYLLNIKRAFESLDDEIEMKYGNPPRFNYNFDKVRKHSKSLPDDISRISYLTEVKTLFEQQDNGLQLDWMQPPFDKQCELEIKKIRDLMKLGGRASISNSNTQLPSEKRAFGGTQLQNILAAYSCLSS